MRDEVKIPHVLKGNPVCTDEHEGDLVNDGIAELCGGHRGQNDLLAVGIGQSQFALIFKDFFKAIIEISIHKQRFTKMFDGQTCAVLTGLDLL